MSDNIYYGIRQREFNGEDFTTYFTINEYYISEAIDVRNYHPDEQDMFINGIIRAHRYTQQGIDITEFLKEFCNKRPLRNPINHIEKFGWYRIDRTWDTFVIANSKLNAVCALADLEDGWEKDV